MITGERIPQHPWNCLFHGTTKKGKQYKKTLVPYLLNAAKGLIPKKWLCTKKPSIIEWLQRVDHIGNMEYLCSAKQGWSEKHRVIWARWNRFKTSEKYSQGMIESA